jgi:hypothetical protein
MAHSTTAWTAYGSLLDFFMKSAYFVHVGSFLADRFRPRSTAFSCESWMARPGFQGFSRPHSQAIDQKVRTWEHLMEYLKPEKLLFHRCQAAEERGMVGGWCNRDHAAKKTGKVHGKKVVLLEPPAPPQASVRHPGQHDS